MKNELIKLMQRGKHCPESIEEIENSSTFGGIMDVMFAYKKDLGKNHFPSASFVGKHYPNVKVLANMNGFFYNEKNLKIRDFWKVILSGNCDCEFTLSQCRSAHIIVRHGSKLRLVLDDYSKANVYLCENASVEVISRTGLSHVNTFNYE